VSASTAAEDRAKGVKRAGGLVVETPPNKATRIDFVLPGQNEETQEFEKVDDTEIVNDNIVDTIKEKTSSEVQTANDYLQELMRVKCLDVRRFRETMFYSSFGRMVLLIRPWAGKLWNIQGTFD
jgi:hypothetical protein